MESKAIIAEHPIHPMLVPFPIGLWTFSLVCDFVYRFGGNPLWSDMAFYTMAGGTIGALFAAVPGLIDFLAVASKDAVTRRIGATHLTLNLIIVALFAVNLWMRTRVASDALTPFVLSIVAIGLLLVSGWLGWEMVYRRGIGTSPAYDIKVRQRDQRGAA
jgi:uncharacterized membrane protein